MCIDITAERQRLRWAAAQAQPRRQSRAGTAALVRAGAKEKENPLRTRHCILPWKGWDKVPA